MRCCSYCATQVEEEAIICRSCGKVVPFLTHYSPADTELLFTPINDSQNKVKGFDNLLRLCVVLLILLSMVLFADQGFKRLDRQQTSQSRWLSRVALSEVSIDKFSYQNFIVVKGKVTNISSRNLDGVIVQAYALNVIKQRIGKDFQFIKPDILLPGETSTFVIYIPCDIKMVSTVKVEIFKAREQLEFRLPVTSS